MRHGCWLGSWGHCQAAAALSLVFAACAPPATKDAGGSGARDAGASDLAERADVEALPDHAATPDQAVTPDRAVAADGAAPADREADDLAQPDAPWADAATPDGFTPTGDAAGPDQGDQDAGVLPDGAARDAAPDPGAPRFGGIVFLYADGASSAQLHWIAATDDDTAEADMRYRVYVADTAEALADPFGDDLAPAASLTGATSAAVTGLAAARTYFVAVVALDQDDKPSPAPRALAVTTLSRDMALRQTPKRVADLDLEVTENGRNDFTLIGAGAGSLAVDDVLVLPYSRGRWLRRVVALSPVAGGVRIQTRRASLDELIRAGEINISATLQELGDNEDVVIGSDKAIGAQSWFKRYQDQAGAFSLSERVHSAPLAPHWPFYSGGNTELAAGVSYDWSAGFESELNANLKWSEDWVDVPERITVEAKGTLSFDAHAGFDVAGGASYENRVELFSRTLTLHYTVGGLYVHQELTLAFFAELELEAEASFNVASDLHTEQSITLTLEYIAGRGWSLRKEDGFEREITFTVDGQTAAKAVVRVVGEMSTRFYKAAELKLSVAPTLEGEIEARFAPLPAEFTTFDVSFYADAWASANVTVLGGTLAEWESDRYELYRVPIFSLPELQLTPPEKTIDTCHPRKVFLRAADGYNNAVQPEDITWEFIEAPGSPELVVQNPEANTVVEFEPAEPGTYVVQASAFGDGFLGTWGRRYAQATFTDEAPDGECGESPPLGPEDVLGCDISDPPAIGLIDFITVDRTMAGRGDSVTIRYPIWCGRDCWLSSGLGILTEIGQTRVWALGTHEIFEYCYHCSGAEAIQRTVVIPDDAPPGAYHVDLNVRGDYAGNNPQSTYLYDVRLSERMFHVYQDNGGAHCDGVSGVPIPTVQVVGAGTFHDGNDDPGEALPLDVNGFAVASQFRDDDDSDFYTVERSAQEAEVYDADIDPSLREGCDAFAVNVVADDPNQPGVCLYATEEDARDDVNSLVCGSSYGYLGYWAAPGVKLYVRVFAPPISEPTPYTIVASADCAAGWTADFAQLTAPLELSVDSVRAGSPVDVTVHYSPNVGEVRLRPLYNGSYASDWIYQAVTPGTSSATVSVPIRSTAIAGTYFFLVTLKLAGSSQGTDYKRDPSRSEDFYWAQSTAVDLRRLSYTSPIPFTWLTVTPR